MGVGVGEGVGSRAEVEWKGAARVGPGWGKGRARAGEGQSKGGARAEQGPGRAEQGAGKGRARVGKGRRGLAPHLLGEPVAHDRGVDLPKARPARVSGRPASGAGACGLCARAKPARPGLEPCVRGPSRAWRTGPPVDGKRPWAGARVGVRVGVRVGAVLRVWVRAGGAYGSAGGLEESVDELCHDEEEEAEAVVGVDHVGELEELDHAQACVGEGRRKTRPLCMWNVCVCGVQQWTG